MTTATACTAITLFGDIDTGETSVWFVAGTSNPLTSIYTYQLNIASPPNTLSAPLSMTSITGFTGYSVISIAVDKNTEFPLIALDATNGGSSVWQWSGSAWSKVLIGTVPLTAIDISKGNDGTLCWVSTEPAFPNSRDYRIYTLTVAGVKQAVGAGTKVDCWD